MGCRQGLSILINDYHRGVGIPSPANRTVPFPPRLLNAKNESLWPWHVAVLHAHAEDGNVHGDCFSTPFSLVLIFGSAQRHWLASTNQCIYCVWRNIVSMTSTEALLSIRPIILIEHAIYWLFYEGDILVFDIEMQTLGVIKKPAEAYITDYWSFQLLQTNDGSGLGFAYLSQLGMHLWERKMNSDGVARSVLQQKIIPLDGLFPQSMHSAHKKMAMLGYDEESNDISTNKLRIGGVGRSKKPEQIFVRKKTTARLVRRSLKPNRVASFCTSRFWTTYVTGLEFIVRDVIGLDCLSSPTNPSNKTLLPTVEKKNRQTLLSSRPHFPQPPIEVSGLLRSLNSSTRSSSTPTVSRPHRVLWHWHRICR
jgi:hypothetical protein